MIKEGINPERVTKKMVEDFHNREEMRDPWGAHHIKTGVAITINKIVMIDRTIAQQVMIIIEINMNQIIIVTKSVENGLTLKLSNR